MNIRNLTLFAGSISLVALITGCTPQARDDVSNAGSDLHAAASDSAKGTKQAIANADETAKADAKAVADSTKQKVAKADDAVVNGTKSVVAKSETAVADTGAAISNGAAHAVQGTEKAVSNAGEAVSKGTSAAVQDTERAAAKVGADTKDSAALLTLTPKVKSAILVDDRVKILDLNIDTKPADKEVVVNGTAPTEEMKAEALSDAKKELAKANSKYKLIDNLKVGK